MENPNRNLAFGRRNYVLMLIGVVVLCVGFFIMTLDTEPYGLGFMGITLGPIVVMAGFVIEFFAIFARSEPRK